MMTSPLSYIFGNNPTNTHYCLLCAQEECEECRGNTFVISEIDPNDPACCASCKDYGSKLVPIAEHPVDHEHVKAAVNLFKYTRLNDWSVEQALDFLMRNRGLAYAAPSKADLWDMAAAVNGFYYERDSGVYGGSGYVADMDKPCEYCFHPMYESENPKTFDTPDEAVKWAFIAQEYETQKERVRGKECQ